MPIISATAISPHNVRGNSFARYWTQQYQDVYNAFVVKPSYQERLLQAYIVKQLVDNGIWSKLDVFQFYCAHANSNGESLLNWKLPGTNNATLHGNTIPLFIANYGFTGNATELAYVNTHFNPTDDGVNFTLNDACYGVYVHSGIADNGRCGVGGNGGCVLLPYTLSGGTTGGGINQSVGVGTKLNTVALQQKGLHVINRTASNVVECYVNGMLFNSTTEASNSLANADFWCLAVNYNLGVNFMNRSVAGFFAGKALTLQDVEILNSCFEMYLYWVNKSYGSHIPLMPFPITVANPPFDTIGNKLYAAVSMSKVDALEKKSFWEYDTLLNVWRIKAAVPYPTDYAQGASGRAVGGKFYYIGGTYSTGAVNGVYAYDPTTDTWETKTPMPTAREDFGTAVIGLKIYCFGGLSNVRHKVLEIYDTETDTWSTGADMPDYKLLGDFGAAVNGKVYAIGASDSVYHTEFGVQYVIPVAAVWEYDPTDDVWTVKASTPLPTVYNERGVIGNYIYQIGGCPEGLSDELATYIKTSYRYDTINDVWQQVADAPNALLGSSLAEYNASLYLLGGGRNGTRTSDTREFYRLVL